MTKNFSYTDFGSDPYTSIGYDPTKSSLYGGAEVFTTGVGGVRLPLIKKIPYLEQGFGVTLAPTVYMTPTDIFTTQMTSVTVLRINRWRRSDLAWVGFISLTIAGAGVKTTRELFVKNDASEVLLLFTSATTAEGGVAWCYGITAGDWSVGQTFAAGVSTIASRLTFVIKQNATNILIAGASMDTSTPAGTLNSGTPNSFVLWIIQSTNTAAGPAFVRLDLGTTMPAPATGIITILDAQRVISGVMLGDFATNLPSATLANLRYLSPGANHGAGITGVPALFYTRGTTTSRIGRKIITDFTAGFTAETDYMAELPPKGATLQAVQAQFGSLHYDINDYFILFINLAGGRCYRLIYTPGGVFERYFGVDCKTYDAVGNSDQPVYSSMTNARGSMDGRSLVLNRQVALGQQLIVIEAGTQGGYVITKEFSTPNAARFYQAAIARIGIGGIAIPTEGYDLYYRTSGISDNSGAWTAVDDQGDLSSIGAATSIQFKIVFSILGYTCVSAQISRLLVAWEDGNSTDSHYEPLVTKSDIANRRFAYRQGTAWGSNIPRMRIRLYNAATGGLELDDDTTTHAFGTFEYSDDGGSIWKAWDVTKDTVGYYIRYTANSLTAGLTIRALLTQY